MEITLFSLTSDQVTDKDAERLSAFFKRNTYISGKYTDESSFSKLDTHITSLPGGATANRLFYLALPPTVYHDVTKNIKHCCMGTKSVHHLCCFVTPPPTSSNTRQLNPHLQIV